MKLQHLRAAIATAAMSTILVGCGGGGGDSSGGAGSGGATPPPTAGAYGWILRAAGPTTALKYGLSLVHPSQPATEYVVEVASAVVSDAVMVSSGSVSASSLRTTSLQPHSLIYIVGGDVRSVPLQADGSAPLSRVQRSQSTSACSFILEAVDNATPLNSRFIVSSAGADGKCDTTTTGDDGRAEVRLTATGALVYTPLSGDRPLGVVRDPSTLAPRGWFYPRSVTLWGANGTGSDASFTVRAPAANAITNVIASTYRQALVDDGTQLSVISFSGGTTFTETPLGIASTAGGGWNLIGFDADSFYVYRNAGANFTSQWRVLKISKSNPNASLLSSGTGLVSVAAMGRDVLYMTVFGQSTNSLLRLSKAGGTPVESATPATTLVTVLTGASDVHERWRVTDVGSSNQAYAIDMIDETGNVLYTSTGGFPMSVADADTLDANVSESRTRFLFAAGYGARGFGNASLISYDTAGRSATTVGTFPGTAEFGSDFVFASTIGGPSTIGMAFAARSSGGSIQEAGAKVYSFDLGAANSLKAATNPQ